MKTLTAFHLHKKNSFDITVDGKQHTNTRLKIDCAACQMMNWYLQGVKIYEVNNGNLEIDRYQSSTTKRMFTTTSVKKMILRKWEQLVSMLASYPHCKFRVLHCTNQYTVSLKMFAQGGIVTLNSINHLSPLLINANCEKE